MKSTVTLLAWLCMLIPWTTQLNAQSPGDYKTIATGNWTGAAVWATFDGSNWNPTATPPDSTAGVITIIGGHTVTLNTTVGADQLVINATGNLYITSAGVLKLHDDAGEDLQCSGSIWLQNGKITSTGTVLINAGGTLQFSLGNNTGAGTVSTQITNNGTLFWANSCSCGTANIVLNLTNGKIINNANFNIHNTGGPLSHVINNGEVINNGSITYNSVPNTVSLTLNVVKWTNNAGASITNNGAGKIILSASTGSTQDGSFVSNGSGIQFKGAASQVYSASSSITGSGTVDFNQGTHTLSGTYSPVSSSISGATVECTLASISLTGFTLSSGTLQGPATKIVTGNLTWTGGTITGGEVIVPSGGTLVVGGFGYTIQYLSANLTNYGTFNFHNDWTGCCNTATFQVVGNYTITNYGLFFFSYPGYINGVKQLVLGGNIINHGTIKTTSDKNDVEFNVNEFHNEAGGLVFASPNRLMTLTVANGSSQYGEFRSNSTTGLFFKGPASHVYESSSLISGSGTVNFQAGTHTFYGGYTVNRTDIAGGITNYNMASVSLGLVFLVDGTFSGSATRTMANDFLSTDGSVSGSPTISGSGVIIIPAGRYMSLYGGFASFNISADLIIYGSVDWNTFDGGDATSNLNLTGGSITNYGLIDIRRGDYKQQSVNGGVINNLGTLHKWTGGDYLIIQNTTTLLNTGIMNFEQGSSSEYISVLGNQNWNGTIVINGGNLKTDLVNFDGPSLTLNGSITNGTTLANHRFNFTGSSLQQLYGNGSASIAKMGMNGTGGLNLNAYLPTSDLLLQQGKIYLTDNNFYVAAGIGGSPSSTTYIVINGTGEFIRGQNSLAVHPYPVGTASGYSPIDITVAGTSSYGNYSVWVKDNVFAGYDDNSQPTAPQVPSAVVNRSWRVRKPSGTSNISVALKWMADQQSEYFNPASCRFGTYTQSAGTWSLGNVTSGGSGPLYTITRTGITSLATTTFAVVSHFTTATQAPGPFCSGDYFNLNYYAYGTFNGGNVFTAQLSDGSGSFATPMSIGTITSNTGGTIACSIPSGTLSGTSYRIRVVSSNPPSIGSNNGTDISITQGTIYYADADGDGYGNSTAVAYSCAGVPGGYVTNADDCNDSNAAVHPGAQEVCNGLDDDCDGLMDDADPEVTGQTIWYADADGDGYGNAAITMLACSLPAGYAANATDCNDANGAMHPGAPELCNSMDDDCDGYIDEDLTIYTFYADPDNDGYGNAPWGTMQSCNPVPPPGWSTTDDDCGVYDPNIHPNAPEVCNGIDDDCDGVVDDGFVMYTFYADPDNDGYGNAPWGTMQSCNPVPPPGWSTTDDDCGVYDPNIHPNAPEVCNGIDDDCDGVVDDGVLFNYFADADGDGYGNPDASLEACSLPAGYVTNDADCNDSDADIHPGANEMCNGIDDDCDGLVDDADTGVAGQSTWYADADSDGYGNTASLVYACVQPTGYVADNTDCDDNDHSVHPNSVEVCNGVDDDCDGLIDGLDPDIQGQLIWYLDADGDGYGDPAVSVLSCNQPSGYVGNNGDCDDTNPDVHPDAEEICNDIDDNCIDGVDERLNCDNNDLDQDGIADDNDNCVGVFNPTQADSDCDTVGDACDVCPGGNDLIDNNNDGRPDCAFPPSYSQVLPAWTCGPKKVLICHRPPGNPAGQNTLCIAYNALPGHMAHGDFLGPCGSASCANSGLAVEDESMQWLDESETEYESMLHDGEDQAHEAVVYPNPFRDVFELHLPADLTRVNAVKVYNALGRLIETVHQPTVQVLYLGSGYQPGVYYITVLHGEEVQVLLISRQE